MTNEDLSQIGYRNMYLLVSILVMVSVQVVLGLLLFGRIVALVTRASGLLSLTSSHAKMTDQTARCATTAVNELREDVKAATMVAKESATEVAERARQQLENAQREVIGKLDSFRPPPELSDESKKIAEKIEKVLARRAEMSRPKTEPESQ